MIYILKVMMNILPHLKCKQKIIGRQNMFLKKERKSFVSFWQINLLFQIFAAAVSTLPQFVSSTIKDYVSWAGPNLSQIFAKIKGVPLVVFYFTLSLQGGETAEQSCSSVWIIGWCEKLQKEPNIKKSICPYTCGVLSHTWTIFIIVFLVQHVHFFTNFAK